MKAFTSKRETAASVAVCPHCGEAVECERHADPCRVRYTYICVRGGHGEVRAATQYAAGVGGAR